MGPAAADDLGVALGLAAADSRGGHRQKRSSDGGGDLPASRTRRSPRFALHMNNERV